MAVTSTNKNNESNSSIPPLKTVLLQPVEAEWPVIPPEYIEEVREELVKSTAGMKRAQIRPKWSEIRSYKKEERPEHRKSVLLKHMEALSLEEWVEFEEKEAEKKVRWSHLVHGFNAVMRDLERGNLLGILMKKNVTPDLLGLSFVPACLARNIPFIPIIDLDAILKKGESLGIRHSIIVLGVKRSVQETPDGNFSELVSKMELAWQSKVPCTNTLLLNDADQTRVRKPANKKEPAAPIDINKYLLRRKDSSHRVFMDVQKATGAADDFISFDQSGDVRSLPVEERVVVEADDAERDPVVATPQLHLDLDSFMSLDTGGEMEEVLEDKQPSLPAKKSKLKGLKRKLSSAYIPAAVIKVKPNSNKKKKRKSSQ